MNNKELTPHEAASLDAVSLEGVEDNVVSSVQDLDAEIEVEPSLTDVGWHDFVMKHFSDDELDPNGRPLVHGLRRVGQRLLGPVLKSQAKVVQAPSFSPGNERLTLLTPAVVEYTLKILCCKPEHGVEAAYPVTFTDAADVYLGNTDPDYARHATATAATKAEARCWRKLLRLKGIAGEETTNVPVPEASVDGFITPTQTNFIAVLCRRLNINVMKYVNSGKKQYERIQDVPYSTSVKMAEHLSGLQNDPSRVDEALKGFDPTWQS